MPENDRGGLFNRANRTIRLEPFTLAECEQFVMEEGLSMDRKDIVSAYMIFGGAPYYWSLLDRSQSLSQNIDRLFFGKTAELAGEVGAFKRETRTDSNCHVTFVTTYGLRRNAYSGIANSEVTMDDLFRN